MTQYVPLAVAEPPDSVFGEMFIDWEVYKACTRCTFWMFNLATDSDVIFLTARFEVAWGYSQLRDHDDCGRPDRVLLSDLWQNYLRFSNPTSYEKCGSW
jgi:hypothetical protein